MAWGDKYGLHHTISSTVEYIRTVCTAHTVYNCCTYIQQIYSKLCLIVYRRGLSALMGEDRKYNQRKYNHRKYNHRKYNHRKYNHRKYNHRKYVRTIIGGTAKGGIYIHRIMGSKITRGTITGSVYVQ